MSNLLELNPQIQLHDATITDNERKELIEERETCFLKSRFHFLMAHNGLRPSCYHVLLGKTGEGKSTLIRDIAKDSSQYGNVIMWLTEEDTEDFQLGVADDAVAPCNMDNIKIYSEKEQNKIPVDKLAFLDMLEESFRKKNPYLIILDNITTSFLYNDEFLIQPTIVKKFGKMAQSLDCPILIVAHPEKGMTKHKAGLMSSENVRGKAQLAMEAPYFYVLQRFQIGDNYFSFITVEKHRKHRIDKKYFQLFYDSKRNSYVRDAPTSFDDVKSSYELRNKL